MSNNLTVIEGPLTIEPKWKGGTETFVSTKNGPRKLSEPRGDGTFMDEIRQWGKEWLTGGTPEFWRVNISPLHHPQVEFTAPSRDPGHTFNIKIEYVCRVIDAEKALKSNVASLHNYFTPYIKKNVSDISRDIPIHQIIEVRDKISYFFDNLFHDNVIEGSQLTVDVTPTNPIVLDSLAKPAIIQVETIAKKAVIDAFINLTGNMSIEDMARAAIATKDPAMIDYYNDIRSRHNDAGKMNFETLKFLLENNLVEEMDLQKHIGNLPEKLMQQLRIETTTAIQGTKYLPSKPGKK